MITLYHSPRSRSVRPRWLLEEIGTPYDLVTLDLSTQEHKSAAHRQRHPHGQVPALVDGDLALIESAAICLHLADTHPDAHLAPPLGTPERAHYYKWLVWCTNTLQAMLLHYFYPERMVADGDAAAAAQVRVRAEAQVGRMLDVLDAQLAAHGADWLLGPAYSTADPFALMLCRWTRGMVRPARSLPHVGPYLQRMLARPAVQRAFATEKLAAPLV